MALSVWALASLGVAASLAQDGSSDSAAATAAATTTGVSAAAVASDGAPGAVAPVPLTSLVVPPPPGAPALGAPLTVRVHIAVDAAGAVTAVTLADGEAGPYAAAVLRAATHFRFAPGRIDGVPAPVTIDFRVTFAAARALPAAAQLRGTLIERGTRTPLPGVRVYAAAVGMATVRTRSDAQGAFCLPLTPGTATVWAEAAGYRPFRVHETVQAGEALAVRYLLERLQVSAYETVVVGERERVEVGRIALSGAELKQVPGTFGDPFRVITTLPGVGTVMSLLGYPVVRGTNPGSTGFLLDAVPVPQLFHLLAGPSVVHPEFIDRVDFYPGTFPAQYGGYVGGIVDGITRRATPADRPRLELNLDLMQAGAFFRGPIAGGVTGTVAARYGYPGLFLAAVAAPVGLTYWDYQGRLDGRLGAQGRFKVFAFGAYDAWTNLSGGSSSLAFGTQFHRLDAGVSFEHGPLSHAYTLVLGLDETVAAGAVSDLRSYLLLPRARFALRLTDAWKLRLGLDAGLRHYSGFTTLSTQPVNSHLDNYGAFVESPLWLTDNLLLLPGARVDAYSSGTLSAYGVDPRLSARFRPGVLPHGDIWLKAGGGRYHQPPRFVVPLPNFEELGLSQGLVSSWQSSVGIELPVAAGADLDVQAYYNNMDRILFDLAFNYDPTTLATGPLGGSTEGAGAAGAASTPSLFSQLAPQSGRAYGLELILRARDLGDRFGWLSYTLSRSERLHNGRMAPFDFDRTHMLQAVMGLHLPRGWEFGGRLQVASGRPVSTKVSYNLARLPWFYRLDVRVDRRVVFDAWLLDFYVDVINVTLAPEEIETGKSFRFPLPTLGVRAVL